MRRLSIWGGFLVLALVDAAVDRTLPLGPAYFLPLALAALTLGRGDALAMAAAATVVRVLFGPVGDPLGLATFEYTLPGMVQVPVNALLALGSYGGLVGVLLANARQRRELARLDREVERDPLTGVSNRRRLQRWLVEHRERRAAVLAIDADHFKRVNDTWGHGTGDAVLVELATRLGAQVRGGDLCVRVGGEEFLLVLPGAEVEEARAVAERVRAAVGGRPIRAGENDVALTLSIGVAVGASSTALLDRADRALMAAKDGGRDRVCEAA